LGVLLDSVGHRVKIHKITSATGKERGDIEIRDYIVLQKPQEQVNRLSPPRTLILDFTMTHTCYGRSIQHTTVYIITTVVSLLTQGVQMVLLSLTSVRDLGKQKPVYDPESGQG
jgi:hypothetical protein